MNIQIEISQAAIEYFADQYGDDPETAREFLQTILPMCKVTVIDGGGEDHLYKTARQILNYQENHESERYLPRFSDDVLEICRKIIEEGEGKPHPWT